MENIKFKSLEFIINDNNEIYLKSFNGIGIEENEIEYKFHNFVELSILGNNKDSHLGNKMANSSESRTLKYDSSSISDDLLVITLINNQVKVNVYFKAYNNTNAISIDSEVINISNDDIIIEEFGIIRLSNISSIDESKNVFFTKFIQSHHAECQPRTFSLFDLGLFRGNYESQKMVSFSNTGSWSTKEELPQGILNINNENYLMFEIESNDLWRYEIADRVGKYYLYLGGNNLVHNGWRINLSPNKSFRTDKATITFGKSINEVIENMTYHRRNIYYKSKADKNLPAIFNEYMHLSWDSPSEETTKKYASLVASLGIKYYVIDCGWHDDVDASIVYKHVGKWKEARSKFPNGVRATTDYLRSLGLKAGLWIEPEIVGMDNKEMIDYYGDDSFITRNGKKVLVMNRYFLDYRKEKVINYMSETIDRMVNEYGADYIKMDYNQEQGVGTDKDVFSFGEGLQETTKAFFDWVKKMEEKYPNVIFEGCSSGGMRMDNKTLQYFPLISTSDQTRTYRYPYIACNILSAVLPEQAAVWSYPVSNADDYELAKDQNWVSKNISDEYVSMNMINSFLGRIHLASDLTLLSDYQIKLVKEGIEFYDYLIPIKKEASPYLPNGFAKWFDTNLASGLKTKDHLCLSIYNLDGNKKVNVDILDYLNIEKVYPASSNVKLKVKNNKLFVKFNKDKEAIFVVLKK